MRADLNDYFYFAQVVKHGGFAAAGRALREPKSKLSRRVAGLEARLGVRLIDRSSRRFQVTEVGQTFYDRCRALLFEAEQAEAIVAEAKSEPHGGVRFSCPTGMVEVISSIMPPFLTRFPKVRLHIVAADRSVDLIEERIDVALRVRTDLTSDASLTMRTLGYSQRILVASPLLAATLQNNLAALGDFCLLSTTDEIGDLVWNLDHKDGTSHRVSGEARMNCSDFAAVRTAAIAGLGVALLPDHACAEALRLGQLVRVLPEWSGQRGIVHIVFTTRRGLPPAVRALIDHIATHFPKNGL